MSLVNAPNPEEVRGPRAQRVRKVLKILTLGLRTVLTLLPLTQMIIIGMFSGMLAVLSYGLVQTVANGTYQIRQMIVTGAMSAKMEPGMWLQLFSDIEKWPKAETFFFTKEESGAEAVDRAIEVRFNDSSLCDVSGTLRIILPNSQ